MEENLPEEALRELDSTIKLNPSHSEAYLSQGLLKKKMLDDEGALRSFERAVALMPDNPVAQHQLGAGYLRSGEVSKAVTHLRKASELKPEERSYLYQLCRALQRVGRAKEAGECEQHLSTILKTRLTADSDLTAGKLNNEGVELENAGKLAAALDKYRSAVDLDPFNTVFRRNLGLALCRLQRWEEGIAELKEVLKADPEDVKATRALHIAEENIRAAKLK
jgi:tetratricopeptide (TPR) repeat protein